MTYYHIAEPSEPPSDRVSRWAWFVVLSLTGVIWCIIVGNFIDVWP